MYNVQINDNKTVHLQYKYPIKATTGLILTLPREEDNFHIVRQSP